MFTFRKQPETIFFTEFVQANGAICAIFQATDGTVTKHRKRVDESLLHACIVEMEEMLQLAVESTYCSGALIIVLCSQKLMASSSLTSCRGYTTRAAPPTTSAQAAGKKMKKP
jgi:hypothetical protein